MHSGFITVVITSTCFFVFLFFLEISVFVSSWLFSVISWVIVPLWLFSSISSSSSELLSVCPFVREKPWAEDTSSPSAVPDSGELSPNLVSLQSSAPSLVETAWDACPTVLWGSIMYKYAITKYRHRLQLRRLQITATYRRTLTGGPDSFIDCHVYSVNSICYQRTLKNTQFPCKIKVGPSVQKNYTVTYKALGFHSRKWCLHISL